MAFFPPSSYPLLENNFPFNTIHLLVTLLMIIGCADDLAPTNNEMIKEPVVDPEEVTDNPSLPSTSQLMIDATSRDSWVYIDLDEFIENPSCPSRCQSTDVTEISGWDLAFQRYFVKSNGGVSGSGGVEIAMIEDQDFDDVKEVPMSGYEQDQEDSTDDEDSDPDYVFNQADGWYQYDFMTHTLSTKNYVYVVLTTDGNYVKVLIKDYYNEIGDAGYPQVLVGVLNM